MAERAIAPTPPRYAWYVVGVLTLANVSGFLDRQVLSLLVPAIERDLHISDTQMSYLIGLSFSVLYTVLGLPIAWWADRANRRNVMATGVTLWSLMTMACGLASTYSRLLLARIGVGVGEATLNAPSVSLIADYFPPERVGIAMSVWSLGTFLGSGLAYFIGGWIVGLVATASSVTVPVIGAMRSWQVVFVLVGAPGLVIALLMLTVRDPRRARRASPPTARAALVPYVRANLRTFVSLGVGFALSASVNFGIAAWLATFLIRSYGWTASRAGTVQGILTMTVGVVGTLAGGRAADMLVKRGHVDAPLRVGIVGALGMLISASAYPLMPTAALAVAWLVVVNFFAAFPWGPAFAAAAEIVPAPIRTQGAALYFFVLSLVSGTLGPTAVAFFTDSVFHDPMALRYSLLIVNVIGMACTIALLAFGIPAYERTARTAQLPDGIAR
ncbi:MAG TPA: MFS transporter [Gemmatimonadaceae bacterium]|jgi:MFS family permease